MDIKPFLPVYLSDVIGIFGAENEYQQRVVAALPSYDRLLIESPENFLKDFRAFLTTAREDFPSCAPLAIVPLSKDPGDDQNYAVDTPGNTLFYLSIKKVRGSHPGVASAG